jgi:hypothetical protein
MSGEGSVDGIPEPDDFADVYHRMLELGRDYLREPVSVKIDGWQDGTFRITVFHFVPGSDGRREALFYHSEEEEIIYGVEDNDELQSKQVVEQYSSP